MVTPILQMRKLSLGEKPAQAHRARKEVGLGFGVIPTEELGPFKSVYSLLSPLESREKSELFPPTPVGNIPELGL